MARCSGGLPSGGRYNWSPSTTSNLSPIPDEAMWQLAPLANVHLVEDVVQTASLHPAAESDHHSDHSQTKANASRLASSALLDNRPLPKRPRSSEPKHTKAPLFRFVHVPESWVIARKANRRAVPHTSHGTAGNRSPAGQRDGAKIVSVGLNTGLAQDGESNILRSKIQRPRSYPSFLADWSDSRSLSELPSTAFTQLCLPLQMKDVAGHPVTDFMRQALMHFVYVHAPTTNPYIYPSNNLRSYTTTRWLPLIVSDPAALHSVVAFATLHSLFLASKTKVAVRDKSERLSQALQHLHRALLLLQERVQDPQEALSNTSIFLACCLTVTSALQDDPENSQAAHHRGLVRMVELRGGINTLPRDIAHQVSRCDANCSYHAYIRPLFPMYKSRLRTVVSPPPAFLSLELYTNPALEKFLCKTLFSAAGDLHYLTSVIRRRRDTKRKAPDLSDDEIEYFEDTYATAQHLLVSLPHPHQQARTGNASVYYQRQHAWRLAALLYFNISIRDGPTPALVSQSFTSLVEALRASGLPGTWGEENLGILTWVIFMGYCGSKVKPVTQGWFATELSKCKTALGIETTSEFKKVLEDAGRLYMEIVQGQFVEELWKEIG